MPPVSGSALIGESISAVPIFDALSRPNWASEHACRPSAADGLSEKPCGSVTDAFLTSGVANEVGVSAACGTCRSTLSPEGESATVVSGWAASEGLKLNLLQPVVPSVSEVAAENTPGVCHESALRVDFSCAVHA